MPIFNPFPAAKMHTEELYSLSQKGILAKEYCSCFACHILEDSVHREQRSSVKY